MLNILIPPTEGWDEEKEEFVTNSDAVMLRLEHSLLSISKWEAKWHKFYYAKKDKTPEELLDYIRCMTINPNVDDKDYLRLTQSDVNRIRDYIDDPMTATTFSESQRKKGSHRRENISSELIYYWMIQYGIPFECEKWHINRLLTLIRICNVKNSKPEKKSNRELLKEHAAINERNKKLFNTKG